MEDFNYPKINWGNYMLCASNPDIITFLEWVKDYLGIFYEKAIKVGEKVFVRNLNPV